MIGYLARNLPLLEALGPAPRRSRRSPVRPAAPAVPRLADLLEGSVLAAKGPLGRPVGGLATDFRRVVPGTVFFSLPGTAGAARAIGEAVDRGAAAVVVDRLPLLPAPARTTYVQSGDVAVALAAAARRHFGFPDRAMTLVGIGGGRGKTSVAHLLAHLLGGDQRVGLLGSAHYELGARNVPALEGGTDALETQGLLAQMRDAGCRQAVLETGARSLVARAAESLPWAAAVFTNSTGPGGPHETAADEWRRVFAADSSRALPVAVVNIDDAGGARLAADLRAGGSTRVVTFGFGEAAEVRGVRSSGIPMSVRWPGGEFAPVPEPTGREQAENLLTAVATAWALGRDPRVVLARLRSFAGAPGRLERIDAAGGFSLWIDAARSAMELRRLLVTVRGATPGCIRLALGDAADADAMDVARALADEIFTGPDRRGVLAAAVTAARPGDAVVAAGRSHEMYANRGDCRVPGEDRLLLRGLLADRGGAGERGA